MYLTYCGRRHVSILVFHYCIFWLCPVWLQFFPTWCHLVPFHLLYVLFQGHVACPQYDNTHSMLLVVNFEDWQPPECGSNWFSPLWDINNYMRNLLTVTTFKTNKDDLFKYEIEILLFTVTKDTLIGNWKVPKQLLASLWCQSVIPNLPKVQRACLLLL